VRDAAVIPGADAPVRIARDEHGIPHVEAATLADAQLGLGFCHARDRGMQILLQRIIGRGQGCRKLRDSEGMLQMDRFFRRLNLAGGADEEIAALSPSARRCAQAYARGVNLYFQSHRVPWELRWAGYRMKDDPWTLADSLVLAKAAGYVSLAQAQGQWERFLVECVQAGVGRRLLVELFDDPLEELDEELLKKVRLGERVIPQAMVWAGAMPPATASNNWAVAPARSASGHALLCNDPHLEVNSLPPVWYEAALTWGKEHWAIGATMPGVPGLVVGRTRELGWSITFAFMDCVDSWIEDCRDGMYRVGDQWRPFAVRTEIVERRKHPPVELKFHENHHGTLDGDPTIAGHYLATRWSADRGAPAESMDAIFGVLEATSVRQGMALLGRLSSSSWNWVLADRAGNIGYQMSGKLPLRRPGASGLVPLPGCEQANDWRGFAAVDDLPSLYNPREGFIVTANQGLNHLGRVRSSNAASASYRADRARQMLSGDGLALDDMRRMQMDVRSLQAQAFMAIVGPLLDEVDPSLRRNADILKAWDGVYRDASLGATVFERFHRALVDEVFAPVLGGAVVEHLRGTSIMPLYFGHFDRVLLSERSEWFGARTRRQIYRGALRRALADPVRPYEDERWAMMQHLMLGGRLSRWLGFDRGPILVRGSPATLHQGQIVRRDGRTIAVGPSYRFVTDMGTDELHTALPGGPSDRRFSRWYDTGTAAWLGGKLKRLRAEGASR